MNKEIKNLKKFLLLSFLISWGAWLPGVLITMKVIEPSVLLIQLTNILNWIGGIGPSLTAFIIIYFSEGKTGLKTLLNRAFKLRLGYWFIPIFLIIPIAVVLGHLVNLMMGQPFPDRPIFSEPWMMIPLFMLFLVLTGGEQFGWRGFAFDKLQKIWNPLFSSILLGVIWAIWHLPMFLSEGFGHHDSQLPFHQFAITLILVSILISWIQNNTNSIAPAFIIHALINFSAEVLPLINTNQQAPNNYLQWIFTNLILAIIVFVIVKCWGIKSIHLKS